MAGFVFSWQFFMALRDRNLLINIFDVSLRNSYYDRTPSCTTLILTKCPPVTLKIQTSRIVRLVLFLTADVFGFVLHFNTNFNMPCVFRIQSCNLCPLGNMKFKTHFYWPEIDMSMACSTLQFASFKNYIVSNKMHSIKPYHSARLTTF